VNRARITEFGKTKTKTKTTVGLFIVTTKNTLVRYRRKPVPADARGHIIIRAAMYRFTAIVGPQKKKKKKKKKKNINRRERRAPGRAYINFLRVRNRLLYSRDRPEKCTCARVIATM